MAWLGDSVAYLAGAYIQNTSVQELFQIQIPFKKSQRLRFSNASNITKSRGFSRGKTRIHKTPIFWGSARSRLPRHSLRQRKVALPERIELKATSSARGGLAHGRWRYPGASICSLKKACEILNTKNAHLETNRVHTDIMMFVFHLSATKEIPSRLRDTLFPHRFNSSWWIESSYKGVTSRLSKVSHACDM